MRWKRCPVRVRFAFLLCLAIFGAETLIAQAPAPKVRFDQTIIPPDVPPQVVIGEDVTFRVRFRNDLTSSSIRGYGPFIDLVLDAGGANITKSQPCACDGMTFVQANMTSVTSGPALVSHQRLAPCTPSPSTVTLTHPFAAQGISSVVVPAGSQLVTLELPFGSYDPTQPEVVVEVKVHVSNLEDANDQLKIYARGGFRFGATPTVDVSTDPPVVSDVNPDSTQWVAQEGTIATVIILNKKYLGAELETVSGPNHVKRYQITVDIASGQTVQNVTVTDRLPDNMAYHAMSPLTTPCFLTPFQAPVPDQAHNGAANWLVLKCASLTGVAGPDAIIVFEFFIPEFDGSQNPILSSACTVPSVNDVAVEALWMPLDACDTGPVTVVSDVTPADFTINAKCLAIQKSVDDLTGAPPAHPIPGDTLQYTLNFQLSDYKTAGSLKVKDVLSDGHTLIPASLMLTVTDQCGTTSGVIPASAWTQTTLACAPGGPSPRFELNIDVSAALASLATPSGQWRHQHGILTGGHAVSPSSAVPATGKITFQTSIADAYQCPVVAPHDVFVDKDDLLLNTVTLSASLLANTGACSPSAIPSATGNTAQDVSDTKLLIASGAFDKTVFAVKRGSVEACGPNSTPCPTRPDVFPGDQVTFRIRKTIPSGDAESLTIQDWLPLPIFVVGPGTFNNVQCGIPTPANSCLGPANTLSVSPPPSFVADVPSNSFTFGYGTFNDPANQSKTIDVLYTAVVTTTPFADGLYLTNEAGECESSTFGVRFCQAAIAEVRVREPALRITKGVIAADNPNAVYSPPLPGSPTFNAPGTSCRRFNGAISSSNLASFNSNISNIDANDCVTFAVVVENTGGSPAYDISLQDLFPVDLLNVSNCFTPRFNTLCVTNGTGTPLPHTLGTGSPGAQLLTLHNPIPGVGTSGTNMVVITFDACVVTDIKPRCCDNTARVESYTSTPGGPNYAGLGGALQDTGQVCVVPRATKLVRTSSEAHTPGTPSGLPLPSERLAVGEIIRYQLRLVVPESTSPNSYKLQEFLPPGMSYLPGSTTTVTMSAGVTATNPIPVVTGGPFPSDCTGGSPVFDFGNVTNTNLSNAQETIDLEFNALVCNVPSNQVGVTLSNSFGVLVNGQQVASSPPVAAIIVEPSITISKVASIPSITAGATASYIVTLTNNGTATAFDVSLTDALPSCLGNLSNVQITTSAGVPAATNSSTTSTLNVTVGNIPLSGTVTIKYSATLSCVDCSQLINSARVTWTSLPGPSGTTTNGTNSPTPGASGLANGERDGSGAVNDYVAVATSRLCCMILSNPATSCSPSGTFAYTVAVTNDSGSAISGVTLTPTSPANTTITPSATAVSLASGASTTMTVNFAGSGVVSGAQICFRVDLTGQAGVVCSLQQCIAVPACCVAPPGDMKAWYGFDEPQGAAVNDIAPSPGSIVNNVGAPSGNIAAVAGRVNSARYFTGGPYVVVPQQSELDFGGGSFSIDAWVRAVGCGPGQFSAVVDKLDTTANAGLSFYLDQPALFNAALKLQLNATTFTSNGTFATNNSSTGPYTLIAVTFDAMNGVGTFYINGLPAGTFTSALGPLTNTLPMFLGETRVGLGSRCEIAIDEVEIFNRALTQAEIKSIFDAGGWGKCRSATTPSPLPRAKKLIKTTSEAHTAGTPSGAAIVPEKLAIGEIIRYRLEVEIPENSPGSYKLQEFLPAGLRYVSPSTTLATQPAGVTATNLPPLVSGVPPGCGGGGPLFDFGTVTNTNSSAAPEILVLEFNAIVCNEAATNQNGTALENKCDVLVNGVPVATSNTVTAIVVEPNITIAKVVTPGPPLTYTVTLTNNGTAAGFDVQLTDTLPACLTNLSNVQITSSGGVTGVTNVSTAAMLNLTIATFPINGTVTVRYTATVSCQSCSQLINTAAVRWTALPGPSGTSPNPTGYATPGPSGLPGGERDGSGGLNDYVAVASTSLCCMQVSQEAITCDKGGTFLYTVTVTNVSSSTVSNVAITALSPANITITPGSTTIPPLAPGASTTVTVTIGGSGAASGASVCIRIALGAAGAPAVCAIQGCLTLPGCCVRPPENMVAWYPLEEKAKEDVNDIAPAPGSTLNNVGRVEPDAIGNVPNPITGMVNGALYFNGPYVAVPHHHDFAFADRILSIDAWVKVDKCEEGFVSTIVDKFVERRGFVFYLEQSIPGTAILKLRVNDFTFTGGSITTGTWFHVAVVFKDQSEGAFFINGVMAGTFTPATGPFSNDAPMWIGKTRLERLRPCGLAIDELEIFNQALREEEIRGIFNAGAAGKCRERGKVRKRAVRH